LLSDLCRALGMPCWPESSTYASHLPC
jgi:hypothetical protein